MNILEAYKILFKVNYGNIARKPQGDTFLAAPCTLSNPWNHALDIVFSL